ncbi:hypothetical protein BGX27_001799 [Mortierella sp. AM989]|nr:hypothetical protein BGX27_001799 [Mortierella sp. AM989]
MNDKDQRINRIKSKEPGVSYFLSLPTATKLSAKDFVLDYHSLFPVARDKWIVEDWHYWKTFYSSDPEWALAFTNEQLSIQDVKRWRNERKKQGLSNRRVTRSSNNGLDLEKDTPTNNPGIEQELSLASATPDDISTPSSASSESSESSASSSSQSMSSSSRDSSLSPDAIQHLQTFFKENFHRYLGPRWVTHSGTDIDEAMFPHIMGMGRETLLHSFIIADDVDLPPSLSAEDQSYIREYIETSDSNHIGTALEEWMQDELSQYLLSPADLGTLLRNGVNNLPNPAHIGDSVDHDTFDNFRLSTYLAIFKIWRVYDKNQYKLPQQASESWYVQELWGFIPEVLVIDGFDHGEKSSKASSTRKNLDRDLSTRFKQGNRPDGMVVKENKELCAIEVGRFDKGSTGTKSLSDYGKLAKTSQDMFMAILSKCFDRKAAQENLTTYAVLISARTEESFLPTALPILLCNHLPPINTYDDAILRRIKVIPFRNIYTTPWVPNRPYDANNPRHRPLDLSVRDRLLMKSSQEQLLVWLVNGAVKWYNHGLGEQPQCMVDAFNDYCNENDMLHAFIKECCDVSAEYQVNAGNFRDALNMDLEHQGVDSVKQKELKEMMKKRKHRHGQTRVEGQKSPMKLYYGLRLAPSCEPMAA